MKILILNNGFLALGLSGGDKHVLSVGGEWAKHHEVAAILPRFAVPLVNHRIRCLTYTSRIPKSLVGILSAYLYRGLRALFIMPRYRAEVVISACGLFDLLPAFLHTCLFKSKLVMYIFHIVPRRHGKTLKDKLQYFIAWCAQQVELPFCKRAVVIFTDNSLVKQELITRGFAAQRIYVQRPVVDVREIQAAAPKREYQVIFTGRLVRQKGIYDLVEAVRSLDVTVGIMGAGDERENLEAKIRQYGLERRVTVLGYLPAAEKHALLKGCDVFVFPSYEEGYGIAIAEAIAAERPVIAYELTHYAEVFANSLTLVPLGDINALRENIRRFTERPLPSAVIRQKYSQVILHSAEDAAALELNVILSSCREKKLQTS